MSIQFFGITFAAPQNMWILPFMLFFIVLLVWRFFRLCKVQKLLSPTILNRSLLFNFSRRQEFLKTILLSLGILCLFFALLRPVKQKEEKNIAQEGRDLFIALDISRSMLATDCEPNRLEFAKKKIRNILSMLASERVGLILFSGSALVQCPLTTDYAAFYMFLDQVDVETISSGTTAMDQAIIKAIDAFYSSPENKTKLLLLFTDGEDFSSNLSGVKDKATEVGMHIFTMGVGTSEGSPVPLYDTNGRMIGHQKDKHEKVVISRLNEGILKNLAEDCGGLYVHAIKDNSDVVHVVKMIESYEKDKFDDKKVELFEERYFYFLAITFICFALGWII